MAKMYKEIHLNEEQKEILRSNLNEEGRISCLKAFKVSRLMKIDILDMSDACKSENIKITDCELGVFGKLKFNDAEPDIYNKIAQSFTFNNDVECKALWDLAKESSLRRVGSTTKFSDVEVINCQLGCFKTRKGHREIKN